MKRSVYVFLLAAFSIALLSTSCGSSSHNGSSGKHKGLKHRDHTWGQFG